jgi:NADPH-dependent ferric siderophore reductase
MTDIPPARDWTLHVADLIEINKSVRRVRLAADGLATLEYLPGQDMTVSIPRAEGDERVVHRRYTICGLDESAELVDIEVVLHGDGPGMRWASTAAPGDSVAVVAPRGKITLSPNADSHVFFGDDSAVPAVMALIAALPPGSSAQVVLEVGNEDEERVLTANGLAAGAPTGTMASATTGDVEVTTTWLHRLDRAPGSPELLADRAAKVELTTPIVHAYVFGEFGVTRALRTILEAKGLAPEQMSVKPYWRIGLSNAPHGEPVRD